MNKSAAVCAIVFVILAILHHDFWNWNNTTLIFGFVPIGLAYHAAFSLVAATFWALVFRFAWPARVEAWADEE